MSNELHDVAERLITFMSLAAVKDLRRFNRAGHLSPSFFAHAEPFLNEQMIQATHGGYEDTYLIPMDAKAKDLPSPLDVVMAIKNEDDAEGMAAIRVKRVLPRDVRGRVTTIRPHMVTASSLVVDADGTGIVTDAVMGSGDGLQWRAISAGVESNAAIDEQLATHIRLAHGLAWTRQMFWYVDLGWDGCPSIMIPTDPAGARSVFRLRDIPSGKSRRTALRTWITEHWRRIDCGSYDETLVRAHLRGETTFNWNGLRCTITPSLDDIRRVQHAIADREHARREGTDRRATGGAQ